MGVNAYSMQSRKCKKNLKIGSYFLHFSELKNTCPVAFSKASWVSCSTFYDFMFYI